MVRRRKWTYIHTHRGASVSPWILPRANKQSTGLFVAPVCALVPPFRIQFHPLPIIKATRLGGLYYWQRMRDSNPRKRSQSPVCYRYTNPLCGRFAYRITSNMSIIAPKPKMSRIIFTATQNRFSFRKGTVTGYPEMNTNIHPPSRFREGGNVTRRCVRSRCSGGCLRPCPSDGRSGAAPARWS